MNPPTTPQPLPFAELLKLANTKPPFLVEYDNDTGPEDGSFWEWYTVDRYRCDSQEEAELIARLLSWAHAGGVELLDEVRIEIDSVDAGPDEKDIVRRLLRSVALLDGQREKP